MKILIATPLYPPEIGGPATYTKLLQERLPALGVEVVVVPFSSVRHLPKGVRHIAYFWKCLRQARSADILYAQDAMSVGVPAMYASMVARVKFLVRIPGDYAWEQGRQRFGVVDELDEFQRNRYRMAVELLRTIQRFVVRHAEAVVVPSAYMKKIVSNWCDANKIEVIYSSIETLKPAAIDRPEGFLVVSAGRRVPWKGFEALERVVAGEKNWHLFIAHDLPRSEVLGWIQAADVFVLNSTYEGLSHILIEAMALGTPVIASGVGGNPEVVGEAGLLVPPKDDLALQRAIKEIEQNPAAAKARAAEGLVRVKRFSIDTALLQLLQLLKI